MLYFGDNANGTTRRAEYDNLSSSLSALTEWSQITTFIAAEAQRIADEAEARRMADEAAAAAAIPIEPIFDSFDY